MAKQRRAGSLPKTRYSHSTICTLLLLLQAHPTLHFLLCFSSAYLPGPDKPTVGSGTVDTHLLPTTQMDKSKL